MKHLKKITLAAALPLMMFASLIGNNEEREISTINQDVVTNISKINIDEDNLSCIDIEDAITDKYVEIKKD